MRHRQVLHGSLRWLGPEVGGLPQPIRTASWTRPAWIEPGDIQQVASLVIEGIEPGAPVSPAVTAFWLAWELLPDDTWTVEAGATLAITEGWDPVAYVEVERVVPDAD